MTIDQKGQSQLSQVKGQLSRGVVVSATLSALLQSPDYIFIAEGDGQLTIDY